MLNSTKGLMDAVHERGNIHEIGKVLSVDCHHAMLGGVRTLLEGIFERVHMLANEALDILFESTIHVLYFYHISLFHIFR
jgi:hypothetical protein